MDVTERAEVLEKLNDLQEETASIEVRIGGIDDSGVVEHDSLYIRNAPPVVIDELSDDYHLAVTEDGVRVY